MKSSNTSSPFSFDKASFIKHVVIGALIALVLMVLLLSGVNEPKPEWSAYWKVRPLLIISLAGSAGGAFFSIMKPLRQKSGWSGFAAYFICFLVYIIGLWMGSVLGLDGTLWN
ncbi:potassium transporter KefB [uncultured Planktosalinus sp.]|mgnify:CR=1 FL=1|uniref:potassium transporter KefB n=1 Tax=uncultured Planktosalinus sp. TaxID=1810935 RepID=UPI0030D7F13A